jgi:hypothetical protein
MKDALIESTRWAGVLAARLRLLQSSFADDLPETRERVLNEELAQALKKVSLGKRRECIEALAEEFPVPEAVEARVQSPESVAPAAMPEDPAELVERLLIALQTMTPEQAGAISLRLQESGLLPASRSQNIEVPEELQERLKKLAPGRPLDQTRALRILDSMIEFALNLDQLVWQVWKNIALKSVIQHESGRYGDLRKALGLYLTGDSEVSTEQIKQIVNKTRKLVSGLMAAMGTVGEIHSTKILDRLSPDAIRKRAEADPGVFEGIEKKCWRKYNVVFGEMNRAALEREVLDAIKKYTEKLVLGAEVAGGLED